MNLLKKLCLVGVFGVIILFSFGCARMATSDLYPKDIRTAQIQITLQFREAVNTDRFRYYIVFSNDQTVILPAIGTYFVPPGQAYNEDALSKAVPLNDGIGYFYRNFYYTWSDYIRYQNSAFYLYQSGGHFRRDITSFVDHISYVPVNFLHTNQSSGKALDLTFSINQLSGMTNRLYFAVVVSDIATDKMVDTLDDRPEIVLVTGQKSGSALDNPGISGSADVIGWKVVIF